MEYTARKGSKRKAYLPLIVSGVTMVGIAIAVVFFWEGVRELEHYGYLGAFLISILGGATIMAPVPMTPIIFVLGTVMKPSFAPYLGPVFVGAAAGLGETVGALIIYTTGRSGGTALVSSKHGKIQALHSRLMNWMKRRGSLVLFTLSAVVNPFFYPAALAAGASRLGLKRYLLVCWGGKTIKGISIAAAGYWGLGGLLRMLGIPI